MKPLDPKLIRQIFLLLLVVTMAALIFLQMLPYLSGILGGITIFVLIRKGMSKLVNKGWNPDLAAALLLLASFVGILLPVVGTVFMLGNKVGDVASNSERVLKAIKKQMGVFEEKLNYDLSSQIDASGISSWVTEQLQGFAGGTFNVIISIGIMYFLLYFMLTNRRKMRESLYEFIPTRKKNIELMGKEIVAMVRSNAIGIPMVAIAQGLVALIGFLIFGVKDPFFWFVIVAVGSMIPFVGTLIGIIPVFILAMSNGDTFQAWGILAYGFVVVGATDNIIRMFILRRLDDVHPLITVIGVIVGVPLFGFIGLIFGPLLISLFLLVVRIYKHEYGAQEDYTGVQEI